MMDLARYTCLGQALYESLMKYKDHRALIEVNRDQSPLEYNYAQTYAQAIHVCKKLQSQGISPQDRVAIIMSNQSAWIFSALGSMFCGATLVPLDYKLTPKEQKQLLQHAQIQALIIEYPLWTRLEKEWDCSMEHVVVVSGAPKDKDVPCRWETEVEWEHHIHHPQREDVATIVYSSGTGGNPKGCMLTHGNYLSQAQVLGNLFPVGPEDLYFSFIPTNHAIDFMCGFLLPLLSGSQIIHQRTLRPEYFLYTIKTFGVSHMALVPMLLKTLQDRIQEKLSKASVWKQKMMTSLMELNARLTKHRPNYTLSRKLLAPIHNAFGGKLKMVFAGGAFVDAQCVDYFYRLGIPVMIGYGLTEAGTVISVNQLDHFRSDTVGTPIQNTRVRIHQPDAEGLGEIWISGPTVMKGYWNDLQLTQENMEGEWLKTGDVGKFDGKHLILKGRRKNMIVTEGGKNVYPEDIESWFEQLENCEEFCIFSSGYIWDSTAMGKEKLLFVARPKKGVSPELFEQAIKEKNRGLSDYKRVGQWMSWDMDFPRTASMKIKRKELADQIKQRQEAKQWIKTI
ncbi:MAG: AMP-binding protein [Bdellovibrionota bacterium]